MVYTGHYVYKYVYNDAIIYIGKNNTNLRNRLLQHAKEEKFRPYLNSKIYYGVLKNKGECSLMEGLLINKYKPMLNVAGMYDGSSIGFQEPKWFLYEESLPVIKSAQIYPPPKTAVLTADVAYEELMRKHVNAIYKKPPYPLPQIIKFSEKAPPIPKSSDRKEWELYQAMNEKWKRNLDNWLERVETERKEHEREVASWYCLGTDFLDSHSLEDAISILRNGAMKQLTQFVEEYNKEEGI